MITTFAIAFSMSADAFAAALSKGATLDRPRMREALRTGLVFGTVETITPFIGWACGLAASSFIAAIDHWIAFALLGVIGLRMIRACATRAPGVAQARKHTLPVLLMTAFATSIDAFAVGVTLALLSANIVTTALAIGAATFVMASLGVMLGRFAGALLGRVAEGLAGLVLIAMGASILTTHLGIF
jgi:manganese efflux pump family protein